MKYHFETYELGEAEIELLNHYASVGPDLCIVFDGQAQQLARLKYNTCIILLAWKIEENYGLQRVPVGITGQRTRAWWAKQLRKGIYDDKLVARIDDLQTVFDEPVETQLMGFMLRTTNFKDHSNHLRCAPDELDVKVSDAQDNICAGLAAKSDAIH